MGLIGVVLCSLSRSVSASRSRGGFSVLVNRLSSAAGLGSSTGEPALRLGMADARLSASMLAISAHRHTKRGITDIHRSFYPAQRCPAEGERSHTSSCCALAAEPVPPEQHS